MKKAIDFGCPQQFPLNHIWIFLTDKCNLRCDYCFFKYKTNHHSLAKRSVKALFSFLAKDSRHQFILSGGEPLLEWEKTRCLIARIRRTYSNSYLSVQSNVILLDKRKTAFFNKNGINIEIGIDGDANTTISNRRGISQKSYLKICQGLAELRRSGVPLSTTMTVYPNGAKALLSNLRCLDQLGARNIEIHPAFLEDWDARTAGIFLREYRKASAYELREGKKRLIGREYSGMSDGAWDMVILPSGKVLPNWTFLSFPEKVREKFYIMDLSSGRACFLPIAESYFLLLREFLVGVKGKATYRQISNFNALLAIQSVEDRKLRKKFLVYDKLCQAVEKIDQEIMERVPCNRFATNVR